MNETVEIPGFATKDNLLAEEKLEEFGDIGYKRQKDLLQAGNFSLSCYSSGDLVKVDREILSFGRDYSGENHSTIIVVRRDVLLNETLANEDNRLIYPDESTVNATTSHRVNYTIDAGSDAAGNSLNSVEMRYSDGSANVSEVDDRSDVETVGIDEDLDGKIETDVRDSPDDLECCAPSDGVIVSDDGNTLRLEFSGNYNLNEREAVIVEYSDVQNPSEGNYSVTVDVNDEVSKSGYLAVGKGSSSETKLERAKMKYVVWRE